MKPEDVPAVLEELKPFFTQIVEGQLKDYGESANAGCWVSFRLPSPEDLECYRGQDRSGRNARTGKRYTLMIMELDDQDETVKQQEPRAYKLSQIAGAKCHEAGFREWIEAAYAYPCPTMEAAAEFIRETCGVASRSLLDTNPDAGQVFRDLLKEFDQSRGAKNA